MQQEDSAGITSSEVGYLWTGYAIDEMASHFLRFFKERSHDPSTKGLLSFALKLALEQSEKRKTFLAKEGFPVPLGFAESEVVHQSAALFTDRLLLNYLLAGARDGMYFYAESTAISGRSDIRRFHIECLQASTELFERVIEVMKEKSYYWVPPAIPAPETPERVQKKSFLHGWFGEVRPMHSMEIANLYSVMEHLAFIEAISRGFAQVAKLEDAVDLLSKGADLAKEQFQEFGQMLQGIQLPLPPALTGEITGSDQSVFSDRIMLCHLSGLMSTLTSLFGRSLAAVMKHDLLAAYMTHMAKTGAFIERVTRFLIAKEWLDKIPGAVDREALIHS